MRYVVAGSLLIAGIIHLLPLSGVLGAPRLRSLYGVTFDEPTTLLLMRHRAVLFGLLGCFLVVAVFRPALRPAALLLGLGSVVSFLALAALGGPFTVEIGRVAIADWVALACLAAGALTHSSQARRGGANIHAGSLP